MHDAHTIAPEDTAVRVALWRALHLEIDALPHVFKDDIALALVGPDAEWRSRPDMSPFTRPFRASIVARARFIEDLVVHEVQRGVSQYVLLGAGLDTFALRRHELASRLRVFEVDAPGPQAWKQKRLTTLGFGIPAHVRFVPVDFEAGDAWWTQLLAAGFDAARPAVVASAGVSMYLTREAIMATLGQVAALAPGSTLVMSFMLPIELSEPDVRPGIARAAEGARANGTPFISFFTPAEMLALGRDAGFRQVRHVSAADLAERYFAGRAMAFVPPSTRRSYSLRPSEPAGDPAMSGTDVRPVRTGYAPVNGLQIYFELHGPASSSSPPLVLVHGGGDTIETSFGRLLPTLARRRRVIAFEQQGCGRTADIADRPFTFAQSAEDMAGLLAHLQLDRVDVLGFSNGGTIALELAMRYPERVRRLVAVTALMKREWSDPQLWESMKSAEPAAMPPVLRDAYLKVAPHPENLEAFFYKSRNRMRDFTDYSDAALRAIATPTLVVGSDRDVMSPEGAVALYRLLPHAQLAILPNTEHMEITSRTECLVPMVEAFLDEVEQR